MSIYSNKLAHEQVLSTADILLHKCAAAELHLPII